jgi:hypothetical protein
MIKAIVAVKKVFIGVMGTRLAREPVDGANS